MDPYVEESGSGATYISSIKHETCLLFGSDNCVLWIRLHKCSQQLDIAAQVLYTICGEVKQEQTGKEKKEVSSQAIS